MIFGMSFDYGSFEWAEERERVLEDWDGLCEHCGIETDSPHVHHKYGTSCEEYEILCPDCHADHHGKPEIALCRKSAPKCKFCGARIKWDRKDGRWVPLDPRTNSRHACRGR